MSLIDLLVRLLMGLFFFVFGINTSVPARPSQPPPTPTVFEMQSSPFRSDTIIHNVDVLVQESFPMQVQLEVTGEHPDGCELPVIIEQRREGNTVIVEIYREIPGDVFCPMMLQPYSETIQIDGNFEPGDYVFRVNDFTVEVTL